MFRRRPALPHSPAAPLLLAALVASCSAASDDPDDDTGTDAAVDAPDGSDTDTSDVDPADTDDADDTGTDGAPDADEDTADTTTPRAALGEACVPGRCLDGLTCANGICAPVAGSCDDGCQDDTYCCGDACDLPDACIPYGTGPRGDVDESCTGRVEIGRFEPDLECEWTAPPEGDAAPDHTNVLATPLVADLPYDSKYGAEILFVSYNGDDGGSAAAAGTNPAYWGVLRILDGETCQQLDSLDDPANRIIGAAPPAVADLDGDGTPEIVAQRAVTGLVAFTWDAELERYVTFWVATESDINGSNRWDGPAIHDLDDDGLPEIITGGEVYDGRTGARLNPGQSPGGAMNLSVVADLDTDGTPELLANGGRYAWDSDTSAWVLLDEHDPAAGRTHYGYGDFGTDGDGAESFDRDTRDGVAEIVAITNGRAAIFTLDGDVILDVDEGITGGGPPTVADFDADGRAEMASAGGNAYRVFDPDCTGPGVECIAESIRWIQPSQDLSSRMTGSSIFDFEQDGSAEAVYGDECFTRIYDGDTGEVLYSSFRTSCTWYENPVVADPDRDGNSEILIGSNSNCTVVCPEIDPIDPGLRCDTDDDCPSRGGCFDGLCRCESDEQCTELTRCAPPLDEASDDVCRAWHPPGVGLVGLRVLRDSLDRWASSRPLWNQHAFTVTGADDAATVPRTSAWTQPFAVDGPNTFRANAQGSIGATEYPDATSRFDPATACRRDAGSVRLRATVCNRGGRPIGAGMPVAFYDAAGDEDDDPVCTTTVPSQLPSGLCEEVECVVESGGVISPIRVRANDDGTGAGSTLECDDSNNAAIVTTACD